MNRLKSTTVCLFDGIWHQLREKKTILCDGCSFKNRDITANPKKAKGGCCSGSGKMRCIPPALPGTGRPRGGGIWVEIGAL